MEFSSDLENIITSALILAETNGNKLVTPEHLLLAALGDLTVDGSLRSSVVNLPIDMVKERLRDYIDNRLEHFSDDEEMDRQLFASHQYGELMALMGASIQESGSTEVAGVPDLF